MTIAPIVDAEIGSSVRGKINSSFLQLNNISIANVRDFGAIGDGVADDTAAIQAAINAVQAQKGRVFLPRGIYSVGAMTIGIEGQRYTAEIVGESWQGDIAQANAGGVSLMLRNGTNASMFTVATTAAPCRFENLYMNGNRSNQTGTSSCIDFPDYTIDSTKARSGHFYNVRIESFRTHGISIGLLRNAGTMDRVTILNVGNASTGACVIMGSCNDWRCDRCDFGGAQTNGIWLTGAGSSVWTACNSFTNVTNGMKIDNTALDNWFIGCSFDTNQQHGVNLVGSTQQTSTSRMPRVFVNCRFNQNGQQTDNTYSDIKLTDELACSFVGNHFLRGTGPNVVKYHVEVNGTTDNIIFANNLIQTASPLSYRTAITNDFTKFKNRLIGSLNAANLPIASTGVSGDLWVDTAAGNVIKRVP